jgi:hypothetical protein
MVMASFSKVTFKKDGAEVFSATVTSGGCFGPDKSIDVANRGYSALNEAIRQNTLPALARDFDSVVIGQKEFAVEKKSDSKIEAFKPGL